MTPLQKEIKSKRDVMRERYGGMMSLEDVRQELGYRSRNGALAAIQEMGLPATQVGRSKKYDTDVVARRLVELRGMC
jgi:hypothetical protein